MSKLAILNDIGHVRDGAGGGSHGHTRQDRDKPRQAYQEA